MPKFSIIIPSYKHLSDCLKPCLESIKIQTDLRDVEVVVVLNGCGDDGSREFVESMGAPFRYVWVEEQSGYTLSTNIGIEAALGEYLILLNNDCVILGPQWINLLYEPFARDSRMGITGPLMLHCPEAQRDFLVFFCVMVSRKMLDEIGILDMVFQPGTGEDTDLSCRAVDNGWGVVRVPEGSDIHLIDKGCEDLPEWKRDKMWWAEFPIFHDGNRSFSDDHEAFDKVLRRNKVVLQERYRNKVNTPTGGCERCGGPLLDGTCVGAENKLNCDGLYLWRASVIDGWFAVDEGAWLASQVKALPKGANSLEIGSWHGRSSRFIADNLSEGAKVWCCDTFNGSSGEPEMHGTAHWDRGDHAAQYWWCNLQEHINTGRVVPVRMHSGNAALTFAHLIEKGQMEKFDFIFIDGDHSEEGIKTDVDAWYPLLKDGGLICGHDYYKESEGPHWVHVRQYVEQKFPDVQKAATSLWWTRKPSANLHQAEIDYQVASQCDDPEYAKVVEQSQQQIIVSFFERVRHDAAILDVGCGNGVAIRILRGNGFTNVNGIDLIDAEGVVKCDMHALIYPDNSADYIYCSHALEHAYDPLKALAEFRRVLRPNGKLFLVLPYPDVIDSEHRAKAHCGSIALGLTDALSVKTLLTTIEGAGFTNTYREQGTLRGEPEIYMQFDVARPRVFDTFIYNDEEEVLAIRLATLDEVVDKFVLVEGTLTHSGKPKDLHFDLHKDRFQQYLHKIIHVIVDDYPQEDPNATIYDNAWMRERHQRDSILHGLRECNDNDIVLLGDADEIANPDAILGYDVSQGLCRLKQRLFYYYLNCENKEGWDWLKIAPYAIVKQLTPCGIRYPPAGHMRLIENGGFHFSMMGGAEAIAAKISAYAHREYDTPEFTDINVLTAKMATGTDLFGRNQKYEFVEVDDSYPQYIKDHLKELESKGFIRHPITPEGAALLEKWKPLILPTDMSAAEENDAIEKWVDLGKSKHWSVTAEVSTKDRYTTTLPMCLTAIITQTHKPDKLVIYDDGDLTPEQLTEMSPFKGLFQMATELGIEWTIFDTPKQGQVSNHQHALDQATTDFIWRVDDDLIATPDCLERLLNTVRDHGRGGEMDNIGAVAPLIHHPGSVSKLPAFVNGSMSDLQAGAHLQWYDWDGGDRDVEHLYSSFIFNVAAARKAGGYPKDLSKIGHREESWFTIKIRLAGYKLLVNPHAKAFHLRESTGGIRSYNDPSLWEHDEALFQEWLKGIGTDISRQQKVAVLDCGIGDHYVFLSILPQFIEKYGRPLLAVCYPAVFEGQDVDLMSIADAKLRFGDNLDQFNTYKFAWEKNHTGPIVEAFKEFYGL